MRRGFTQPRPTRDYPVYVKDMQHKIDDAVHDAVLTAAKWAIQEAVRVLENGVEHFRTTNDTARLERAERDLAHWKKELQKHS